jgi:hypothetical protein
MADIPSPSAGHSPDVGESVGPKLMFDRNKASAVGPRFQQTRLM